MHMQCEIRTHIDTHRQRVVPASKTHMNYKQTLPETWAARMRVQVFAMETWVCPLASALIIEVHPVVISTHLPLTSPLSFSVSPVVITD